MELRFSPESFSLVSSIRSRKSWKDCPVHSLLGPARKLFCCVSSPLPPSCCQDTFTCVVWSGICGLLGLEKGGLRNLFVIPELGIMPCRSHTAMNVCLVTKIARGTSLTLSETQNQSFLLPPQTFGPGIDGKMGKSMAACLDTNTMLRECINMRQGLPCGELDFFCILYFIQGEN